MTSVANCKTSLPQFPKWTIFIPDGYYHRKSASGFSSFAVNRDTDDSCSWRIAWRDGMIIWMRWSSLSLWFFSILSLVFFSASSLLVGFMWSVANSCLWIGLWLRPLCRSLPISWRIEISFSIPLSTPKGSALGPCTFAFFRSLFSESESGWFSSVLFFLSCNPKSKTQIREFPCLNRAPKVLHPCKKAFTGCKYQCLGW